MQFKDAAFEILKETGKPFHYNEMIDITLGLEMHETAGHFPPRKEILNG